MEEQAQLASRLIGVTDDAKAEFIKKNVKLEKDREKESKERRRKELNALRAKQGRPPIPPPETFEAPGIEEYKKEMKAKADERARREDDRGQKENARWAQEEKTKMVLAALERGKREREETEMQENEDRMAKARKKEVRGRF
jgi:hypothetical protein